jgi:hypothetical protein
MHGIRNIPPAPDEALLWMMGRALGECRLNDVGILYKPLFPKPRVECYGCFI